MLVGLDSRLVDQIEGGSNGVFPIDDDRLASLSAIQFVVFNCVCCSRSYENRDNV